MPNWQTIIVFCFAFAATMYFKFALPDPDRGDVALDKMDSRMARLMRYRMEHGACVHCGEPRPRERVATTPTCPHCGSDFSG